MVVLLAVLLVAVVGAMVALGVWVLRLYRTTHPRLHDPVGSGLPPRSSSTPSEMLLPQLIDLDQLTGWVLNHLPGTVSGSLDADDIRRIVEWNLDFIRSKRAATNGHASKPARQVIVAGAETAEYVLQQATDHGLSYTPEQVHAVLDAQMAFLESIGAAGPEIEGN